MANKRDTSKQKRARQNRAQREALKARTSAASTPAPERRKAATPARTAPDKQEKKRGFFSPPADRPLRPGDTPVDIETLEGSWVGKRMQVPGGRQVLMAWLFSAVVGVSMFFTKVPTQKVPGKGWNKANIEYTSFSGHFGVFAFVIVAVPIILCGIAALAILHPRRRLVWRIVSFAMFAFVLLGINANAIVYLFPTGMLFYGMARANRIEGPATRRRGGKGGDGGDAAGDEGEGGDPASQGAGSPNAVDQPADAEA